MTNPNTLPMSPLSAALKGAAPGLAAASAAYVAAARHLRAANRNAFVALDGFLDEVVADSDLLAGLLGADRLRALVRNDALQFLMRVRDDMIRTPGGDGLSSGAREGRRVFAPSPRHPDGATEGPYEGAASGGQRRAAPAAPTDGAAEGHTMDAANGSQRAYAPTAPTDGDDDEGLVHLAREGHASGAPSSSPPPAGEGPRLRASDGPTSPALPAQPSGPSAAYVAAEGRMRPLVARSILDTEMVNGKPLGDNTGEEAMAAADNWRRDGRALILRADKVAAIAGRVPPNGLIRDYVDAAEAEAIARAIGSNGHG